MTSYTVPPHIPMIDYDEEYPEELEFLQDIEESNKWFEDTEDKERENKGEMVSVTPSEWTEFAIRLPINGIPTPFSFEGREYLKTPYNIKSERVILQFGRQSEKSINISSTYMNLDNGYPKSVKDVFEGCEVSSINIPTNEWKPSKVTWRSRIYKKPCYRITTESGYRVEVGHEHPMRVENKWVPANEVKENDKIVLSNKTGLFTSKEKRPEEEYYRVADNFREHGIPYWVFELDKSDTYTVINAFYGHSRRYAVDVFAVASRREYLIQLQSLLSKFRYRCDASEVEDGIVISLPFREAGDTYTDNVSSIEFIGECDCIDFTVADTHTFIANGFVTHNSTLLSNSILSKMCITPHFRALYVSSSMDQTRTFRREKIGEAIALSDILKAYITSEQENNLSLLKLINFASLTLRYAFLNADRCRGLSVDSVYIDEIQDVLTDSVAVIEECAAHGNPALKSFIYSGTPKTFDGTLTQYWEKLSTQNEWAVPSDCESMHFMTPGDAAVRTKKYFWNVPLNERNMGSKSLICSKSGKPITPQHPDARWVSLNPAIRKHPRIKPFEGFRVPQIMVPWLEWSDIMNKRESYSPAKFANEVLALPYDSGDKPIKMADLMRNSTSEIPMGDFDKILEHTRNRPIFFGLDHGTGENSYSVLSIGGYLGQPGGKFTYVYFHRFMGEYTDPELQMEFIFKLVDMFRPVLIGCDYGGGFDRNRKLVNRYGRARIHTYQYLGMSSASASKRNKLNYDGKKGRYLIDRTEVMTDFILALKDGKLAFPQWNDWSEPYGSDFLSLYSEYNDTLKAVQYKKPLDRTDDTFHSSLYALIVSMMQYPRPDIIHRRD
jgi:hypothetical protein